MASSSTFPNTIDSFVRKYDIQASDIASIQRFQQLKLKNPRTTDENTELANLANQLANKLISPDDWNKFADAVQNLEQFFLDNVQGYLNAFQSALVDKGAYSSTTTYAHWNMVKYNGETYMSKQDNNIGNLPISDGSTDLWWTKVAAKGDQGVPGISVVPRGIYNNTYNYQINDAVYYNQVLYAATQSTTGNIPSDTSPYWIKIMDAQSVYISSIAPSSPAIGQVWIDTSYNPPKYKYYSQGRPNSWKEIGVTLADNSTQLNGQPASYYAKQSDLNITNQNVSTNTINIQTNTTNITNLTTTVNNNTNTLNAHLDRINKVEYDVYNLELQNTYDGYTTQKQGLQYDGFVDMSNCNPTKTVVMQSSVAGATQLYVKDVTGFKLNTLLSVYDATNYEEKRVVAIDTTNNVLTLDSSLTNAYTARKATVSRTSSVIDTVNKRLTVGTGYWYNTQTIANPTTVINASHTISGNGGQKIIMISNGWILTLTYLSSVLYVYVSKDNGQSFQQLCTISGGSAGASMVALGGTMVGVAFNNTTSIYFLKFDAAAVTNTDQNSNKVLCQTQTSISNNLSMAVDKNGRILIAYAGKNATYSPSNVNASFVYSVDGGATWAVNYLQSDSLLSTSAYTQNPSVSFFSDNRWIITWESYTTSGGYYLAGECQYIDTDGSIKSINIFEWIASPSTAVQANIDVAVDSQDYVHCVFEGADTQSSNRRVHYVKSTTSVKNGSNINFTAEVLVNPNSTIVSKNPVIALDNHDNPYIYFEEVDTTINATYTQIKRVISSNGSFGNPTTLTSATTANCTNAQVIWSRYYNYCDLFTDTPMIFANAQVSTIAFRGSWDYLIAPNVKKTVYYSTRQTYPQIQTNVKPWITRNVTTTTTASAIASAGTNTLPVTDASKFLVGDLIDIYDSVHFERGTITSINSNTITLSANLANAYPNGATVNRIHTVPQIFIGLSTDNENFANLMWQRSSVNADGTIEDTYFYQTSNGGTDVTLKLVQSRNDITLNNYVKKYGMAVGI